MSFVEMPHQRVRHRPVDSGAHQGCCSRGTMRRWMRRRRSRRSIPASPRALRRVDQRLGAQHRVVRTVRDVSCGWCDAAGGDSTSRVGVVMAHVRRARSDRGWEARYRDPGGRERSRTFATRREAQRFADRQSADVQRGEFRDPRLARLTVAHWAELWFATTVDLKPNTRCRVRVDRGPPHRPGVRCSRGGRGHPHRCRVLRRGALRRRGSDRGRFAASSACCGWC